VPPVEIVDEELVEQISNSPGTHMPTMDFVDVLMLGALVQLLAVLALAAVLRFSF
jgi:hypothetical protein